MGISKKKRAYLHAKKQWNSYIYDTLKKKLPQECSKKKYAYLLFILKKCLLLREFNMEKKKKIGIIQIKYRD